MNSVCGKVLGDFARSVLRHHREVTDPDHAIFGNEHGAEQDQGIRPDADRSTHHRALRGMQHRCIPPDRDASGSSRLHRVHHRQAQRATPGRDRSCGGEPGLLELVSCGSIVFTCQMPWRWSSWIAGRARRGPGNSSKRGKPLACLMMPAAFRVCGEVVT
jgi:hypothetical protein